ncbi:uncharacterized protein LOC114294215 [Camellia sinensis]|uniref:uncharacterized protein LOC114294215 n=1 Tax=Camellia sinensis TaxID=4442 RepID=UPI0010369541|nr:uncharacterized protein LOC114294215 [Camellia sinensis]
MGLHPDSPLCSSLTRLPPKTVWALMKKVEEYCKVEDDALRVKAGRKSVETTTSRIVQPISFVPSRNPKQQNRPKRDKRCDSRRSNDQCSHRANEQYQVNSKRTRHSSKKYMELTKPINKTLSKLQHLPFLKWPPKMMGPPDARKQDKRCEYHKDYGHDTDSCYALKDHLEELVQDDHLTQHVRKSNSTNTVALWSKSPPLGVIHMIYSLSASSEEHTIQLPSSPHSPITPAKWPHDTGMISLDDSDLVRMTDPHTDTLVIELCINRFTIERVLIDHGNTSKIMYYKTIVKLGFTDSNLSPADYPLLGFNANLEYPLGKITLLIRADIGLVDVEFQVVKLPSPYNLILGKTWLHTMQAVPSTYTNYFIFRLNTVSNKFAALKNQRKHAIF